MGLVKVCSAALAAGTGRQSRGTRRRGAQAQMWARRVPFPILASPSYGPRGLCEPVFPPVKQRNVSCSRLLQGLERIPVKNMDAQRCYGCYSYSRLFPQVPDWTFPATADPSPRLAASLLNLPPQCQEAVPGKMPAQATPHWLCGLGHMS